MCSLHQLPQYIVFAFDIMIKWFYNLAVEEIIQLGGAFYGRQF